MRSNFDDAFAALMGNEGGYSNNPADPGGETMYGITKRVAVANDYTGDMRDLPLDRAKSIAKAVYWDPVDGDSLADRLDFQVFDAAYNSGVSHAKEWLAKSSPQGSSQDPVERIIMRFDANRLLFLCSLGTWPSFGKGWTRRVAGNLLRAAG